MKKLLIILIASVAVLTTNAQSERIFKPFKFDISAGYAVPANSGANGGFLLSFEPKYGITDYLSVGIKAEINISVEGDEDDGTVFGTGSYLATGDYYFTTSTARPFAGIGVGIFTHASSDIGSTDDIDATTNFGFAPRIGVEISHFRAALEYNFAGKVADINKSYFGIKLGVLIGGGRYEY